jgi:hypothetical protein
MDPTASNRDSPTMRGIPSSKTTDFIAIDPVAIDRASSVPVHDAPAPIAPAIKQDALVTTTTPTIVLEEVLPPRLARDSRSSAFVLPEDPDDFPMFTGRYPETLYGDMYRGDWDPMLWDLGPMYGPKHHCRELYLPAPTRPVDGKIAPFELASLVQDFLYTPPPYECDFAYFTSLPLLRDGGETAGELHGLFLPVANVQSFILEANKQIRFWPAFATTPTLESLFKKRCRVAHFAGRVLGDTLQIEDADGYIFRLVPFVCCHISVFHFVCICLPFECKQFWY